MRPIRKAVFPVAGLGTRILPATKAIPKEMLTLIDKPLIQYAVEEARDAGIEEFIFVNSPAKRSIEQHFLPAPELQGLLDSKGKWAELEAISKTILPNVMTVYQVIQLGLGHAISRARHLVGNEPFAVILPDDVIMSNRPAIKQLIDVYEDNEGQESVVAVMNVSLCDASKYGIVVPGDKHKNPLIRHIIEKPKTPPSQLAVVGRYVLHPEIFGDIRSHPGQSGGEIQLTDAIATQISKGHPVRCCEFEGQRFDCGSKIGFFEATVAYGLKHAEIGSAAEDIVRSANWGLKHA